MRLEIEASIGCCKDCPKRVEKYLKRIKGVQSVDLFPEISKVVVIGDVDPDIVLHEVQKVRKNAQILTKDSPANNLSAMAGGYGCRSQQNISMKKIVPADAALSVKEEASKKAVAAYKIKPADEVLFVQEEASEKAVAAYTPPKPSNVRDKDVASEKEKYSLRLSYGLFEAGASYSRAKTYENNREGR